MDGLKQAAQQASSGVQQTDQQTQESLDQGSSQWDAMSEDQKQQAFDSLPEDKKKGKTYLECISEVYQHQKENWMPWIEDVYLKFITKDNKASYATKETLRKSKVTGVEQVDKLQDGVNDMTAGQVGQGGLLQPVGDVISKEGVNRAQRAGKVDCGRHGGSAASGLTNLIVDYANAAGEGASSYADAVMGGKKSG